MIEPRAIPETTLNILHVLRAEREDVVRQVVDLAHGQTERGHHVGIVAVGETRGPVEALLAECTTALAFGVRRLSVRRPFRFADPIACAKVEFHARRVGAHVVHGHGVEGGIHARACGLFRLGRRPIRCYTPANATGAAASGGRSILLSGVEQVLAAATDVLLFGSVHQANAFHARHGEGRAAMRIVPPGIGPEAFVVSTADREAADFLFIGDLCAGSGLDTLIDAAATLQRRLGRPVHLAIVGEGPDRAKNETHVHLRGLAATTRFHDVAPHHAFALGRVLVVPGHAEAPSSLLLQAAGAHVPMVVADVGGNGEILGPYRDRLVPVGDAIALARTLEHLIESEPACVLAQARGLAAYVAARHSHETMTASVLEAYREGFARRAAAPPAPIQDRLSLQSDRV